MDNEASRPLWHYGEWRSWANELAPWLDDRFNPTVLATFTENVEPDWLTWLDSAQAEFSGLEDSVLLLQKILMQRYRGIRLYHATRLIGPEVLATHGIRAWSAIQLREMAADTFGPLYPAEVIRTAMESAMPAHRGGSVYTFRTLELALPGQPPHFLTDGGEWLGAVAENLGDDAYLRTQRQSTRAYLVACDIPWSLLANDTIRWLAKDAFLTVLTLRFLDLDKYEMPCCEGVCISVPHSIPPTNIYATADLEPYISQKHVDHSMCNWIEFGSTVSDN